MKAYILRHYTQSLNERTRNGLEVEPTNSKELIKFVQEENVTAVESVEPVDTTLNDGIHAFFEKLKIKNKSGSIRSTKDFFDLCKDQYNKEVRNTAKGFWEDIILYALVLNINPFVDIIDFPYKAQHILHEFKNSFYVDQLIFTFRAQSRAKGRLVFYPKIKAETETHIITKSEAAYLDPNQHLQKLEV